MLRPVTRDERDASAAELADDGRCRGRAVRRFDLDGLGRFEERIEPRTAEDADLGGAQDAFSPLARFGADLDPDSDDVEDDEEDGGAEGASLPASPEPERASLPPSPAPAPERESVSAFGFDRLSVA